MTRIAGRRPHPTALHAERRRRELDALGDASLIDVLVIGGGITGVGVALDAASRGLRTVLVERRDLAHGTSRWSSKLIHGGLRYLATGQLGIAHESAAERHLMMTRIAPHLTRPLAQVLPLYAPGHRTRGAYVGIGFGMGDGLRRLVGTPDAVLGSPGPIGRDETLRLAPAVQRDALRGGMRGWDGQLFDDARLVIAVARTAAGYGASVLTRVEAVSVRGDAATLRDALTGAFEELKKFEHVAETTRIVMGDDCVVSMPSVEWFEEQPRSYRDSVLPPSVKARVAVEAGIGLTWHRFVGDAGRIVSLEHFGASADAKTLFAEYGFTPENVVAASRESLAAARG